MADIVSSLFGLTPIQESAELAARQRDLDLGTLAGQAFVNTNAPIAKQLAYINKQGAQAALLGSAGRAIGGLFGLQDPQLQRATQLESLLGETQMELGDAANDPTQFYPTLQKKLADAGFGREAILAGQAGQKAIQDYTLSQAKLTTEQAQLAKARQEKLPEIVRLKQAYDEAVAMGDMSTAQVIAAQIDKSTYVAERNISPENRAEQAKLNSFISEFGETEGSTKFLEWKNQLAQKVSAAQGTGTILSETGKPIGQYGEKGEFITPKGEVIPKEQMIDFRNSQQTTSGLLNLMTNITEQDIDNAFGKLDTTQGGAAGIALRATSNPDVVAAQTKINGIGVKEVLTNLQQLKGASSDKEMSRVASTFPGFEAPPQVMKEWLARALLTSTEFLNKNKDRYGFEAPPVDIQSLGSNPLVKTLPARERANLIERLAKFDENFKQLSEKDQIKVLNSIMSDGKTKKQTRTTKSGVTYTIEE